MGVTTHHVSIILTEEHRSAMGFGDGSLRFFALLGRELSRLGHEVRLHSPS
jgi:hypothetical protein